MAASTSKTVRSGVERVSFANKDGKMCGKLVSGVLAQLTTLSDYPRRVNGIS